MKDNVILKYDKEVALKSGAFTYKLCIFMLSVFALMILISSAVFDYICYKNGFSDEIVTKYTAKILYMSLFVALVWVFTIPVWFPAHYAENSIYVKKDNKLYRIRCKKDNIFDREKYLDNQEFLQKVIDNLPNSNERVIIDKFEEYEILKKNKKNITLAVKNDKNKKTKIKIYNIYSNYNNL
jgi:hypothetical protein